MRTDPGFRHPAEVGRHADAARGERQSEHAARLRAAGLRGRRRGGQESGRRGDQEGARARHAAAHRAAHPHARRRHVAARQRRQHTVSLLSVCLYFV